MDQLVFKMDEPPELEEIDESSMFKMDPSDLDVDFSPQTRTRCNTWPLPRPDNYVDEPSPPTNVKHEDYETLGELGALLSEGKCNGVHTGLPSSGGLAQLKKTATSRRNAWGSSSYADLISQAITSSPEQRLTLSQIYDWMIQNVPYFKDKGDSNSSAGWKVRSYLFYYILKSFQFLRVIFLRLAFQMILPNSKLNNSLQRSCDKDLLAL
ncbi:hypothetical protein WDU94_012012 [Cyamophila willieti]